MKHKKPDWIKAEEKQVKKILKEWEDQGIIDRLHVTVATSKGTLEILSVYLVKGD